MIEGTLRVNRYFSAASYSREQEFDERGSSKSLTNLIDSFVEKNGWGFHKLQFESIAKSIDFVFTALIRWRGKVTFENARAQSSD